MDKETSRRFYNEPKNKNDPDRAELEAWFREYERWMIKYWQWEWGRTVLDDLRERLFRRWLGLR